MAGASYFLITSSIVTMRRAVVVLLAAALGISAGAAPSTGRAAPTTQWVLVNTYDHDSNAFTQGLDFHNGRFYETTGTGPASLRLVDLDSGNVEKQVELPSEYFGEGMTVRGRKLYWITWKSETAFVYDPETFERRRTFHYKGQGWGLTHNGSRLIMSKGSPWIVFRDPQTFEITRRISVTDEGEPVTRLNELEWVNGQIFANVWQTDLIARIDPSTGEVVAWIDLGELKAMEPDGDVTNGIAYLKSEDRLFVTGKYWSHVYEIALVE